MNPKKKPEVTKTDIELCFKALGVPYEATPAEVDKAYFSYMEQSKRGLLSADPYKVLQTKEDMELISNLHFNIKKSITYQDRLKGGDFSQEKAGYAAREIAVAVVAIVAKIVLVAVST